LGSRAHLARVKGGGGVVGVDRNGTSGSQRRPQGRAPAAACCPVAVTTIRGVGQRRRLPEVIGEVLGWVEGGGFERRRN
jgi:hypothetical protein